MKKSYESEWALAIIIITMIATAIWCIYTNSRTDYEIKLKDKPTTEWSAYHAG